MRRSARAQNTDFLVRCDPVAAGIHRSTCPTFRRRTSRTHSSKTLSSTIRPRCAMRRKNLRDGISRTDAADIADARPRRDQAFRKEHGDLRHEAALWQRRRSRVSAHGDDLNFGSLYDLFAVTFREPWVVQKFLPAVKKWRQAHHSRRWQICRRCDPRTAEGDLRSNLVRGGRGEGADLTPREREICERIGPSLARADYCLSAST